MRLPTFSRAGRQTDADSLSKLHQHARESWYRQWLSQDFSWEGLGRIPFTVRNSLGETYEVSLQDYWQGEADKLIEAPDGRVYTRYHLPFEITEKGRTTPTEKANWDSDTWAQVQSDLKARYRNDDVPISREKLPREESIFRTPLPPNDAGIDRDLSAVVHDMSGLSLNRLPPEISNHPVYKRHWMHLQQLELLGDERKLDQFDVVLKHCLVTGYVLISDQNTTASILLTDCLITGSVRILTTSIGKLTLDQCTLESFDIRDTSLGSLKIASKITAPDHCTFYHTSIEDRADFRSSSAALVGAFYTAKIQGRLMIDPETDGRPADHVFRKDVIDVALQKVRRPLFSKPEFLTRTESLEHQSKLFRRIEGGALVLKTKMREENFEELAHRFYRYELWARTYNPSTDLGTRMLLTLYRWSSQYGYNVTRPLIWILILSFVLAFVYLLAFTSAHGWTFNPLSPDFAAFEFFGEAWSFSLGRVAPVIPWSAGIPVPPQSFEYELKTMGGFTGLTVHFIGILQTIASTCLFFLTALAGRRRFKMSD